MKKIVFIGGLPGSGKSTVAEYLYLLFRRENIKALRLDIDSFKRESKESSTDSIDSPDIRWEYTKKAINEAVKLLYIEDYELIVMDEMFHVGEIRKKIESLCNENLFCFNGLKLLFQIVLS